eukprot:11221735-Ditylum_brightwellii.AAC.1
MVRISYPTSMLRRHTYLKFEACGGLHGWLVTIANLKDEFSKCSMTSSMGLNNKFPMILHQDCDGVRSFELAEISTSNQCVCCIDKLESIGYVKNCLK